MALAFLLAAAPAPALVTKADQTSQTYIACLFAVSRASNGERLPLAEFERRLAKSCIVEEQAARQAVARVLSAKGEPDAAATARQATEKARSGVIDTYETIVRMEPQLERLNELCRQRPDACR